MLYHVLVKRWRQGVLHNLGCLGPSTRELGGDLTIWKHGLAQLGEAVGDKERQVVFGNKVGKQDLCSCDIYKTK